MRWFLAGCTVLLAAAGIAAQVTTCTLDADCDDAVECNGVETCGTDGLCEAGVGLCEPLRDLVGRKASASSYYSAAYHPTLAFNGVNDFDSSWCSLRTDTAPEIAIDWPVDVQIDRIEVSNSWVTNSILAGRFVLTDRDGNVRFDSGLVSFSSGELDLPLSAAVKNVRSLRLYVDSWAGREPCIGDMEISGGLPCATDLDCEFVSPCIAAGVCQPSGNCSATAGHCRNLAPGSASFGSSTDYTQAYTAANAIDEINSLSSSWCAADADTGPNLWLQLPNPRPVSLLNVRNPWTNFDFDLAELTIRDDSGLSLYTDLDLVLENGETQVIFDPPVAAALTVDLLATEFDEGPCIGELELLAEYCEISVAGSEHLLVRFHPGTPTPSFELRFGSLSELRDDGDFIRSTCWPRSSQAIAQVSLPTPVPGDGYYLIGRGLNVCEEEGYGLSWASPDPRAQLSAFPECP